MSLALPYTCCQVLFHTLSQFYSYCHSKVTVYLWRAKCHVELQEMMSNMRSKTQKWAHQPGKWFEMQFLKIISLVRTVLPEGPVHVSRWTRQNGHLHRFSCQSDPLQSRLEQPPKASLKHRSKSNREMGPHKLQNHLLLHWLWQTMKSYFSSK